MRIFLDGNEELARYHLPVVQSKATAFAKLTEERGLKQNMFRMNFEDTGAKAVVSYCYGKLHIGIYAPYSGEGAEEIVTRQKLYEWNFIYSPGEVNGYGLGAFLAKDKIVIPVFKAGITGVILESKSTDISLYYGEYTPLSGLLYNNKFGHSVISRSIIAVVTRYNTTDIYSIVSAEDGDIVYSSIWTTSGFSPFVLPEKGNTVFFIFSGDFSADETVDLVIPYVKTGGAFHARETRSPDNGYSVFYLDSFFGAEIDPLADIIQQDNKGLDIYAELVGTQTFGSTYTLPPPYYNTVQRIHYEISIKIVRKLIDTITTSTHDLLDHEFSNSVDSCVSFSADGTPFSTLYPLCVNFLPYAAKRNVVLIATSVSYASSIIAGKDSAYKMLFTPGLLSPTGMSLYQLINNAFVVVNGNIVPLTISTPISLSHILKWSDNCYRFMYKEVSYTVTSTGIMTSLTGTGKIKIYEFSAAGMLSVFEITSYTSSTIIWHSLNFDTIVIKGTPTQDGIYRYDTGAYVKLGNFTDEEPVFLSDDGTVVATKTIIYFDDDIYTCTECVGVFFDKTGYVDKVSDNMFQIKDFSNNILESTADGLYNFYELSEDSSFAVLSHGYTNVTPATATPNALVIDFADGPKHFEETNLPLTQLLTTVRNGRRYFSDTYIKPPWAVYFTANEELIRLRTKCVCVNYANAFEYRNNPINNGKRLLKHFWHHVLGIFERLVNTMDVIPYDVLNPETRAARKKLGV